MSYTGWWGDKIIITLHSDGVRRHKMWCIHYEDKNYCSHLCSKCIGSAFCESYRTTYFDKPTPAPNGDKEDGDTTTPLSPVTLEEYYSLATRTDKLLGKILLIRDTPSRFRIGRVVTDSFDILGVQYDGKLHKFSKRVLFANGRRNVYVLIKEVVLKKIIPEPIC